MEKILLEKVIRSLTITLQNVSVRRNDKKRKRTPSLFHQLVITHNQETFIEKKEFSMNNVYFVPSGYTLPMENLDTEREGERSKVGRELTGGDDFSYDDSTHCTVLEFAAMSHGNIDFIELAQLKPSILKKSPKVVFSLEMVIQEYENQKLGGKSISNCAMQVLFILILRYMVENNLIKPISKKRISSLMNYRLIAIFIYIMDNLCGNLSNSAIAKAVNLSSAYTAELFKEVTGETLQRYVRLKRLHKAKMLLMTTGKSVKEIASEVGFKDDSSYFCRVFKKEIKLSPNDFREAFKRNNGA